MSDIKIDEVMEVKEADEDMAEDLSESETLSPSEDSDALPLRGSAKPVIKSEKAKAETAGSVITKEPTDSNSMTSNVPGTDDEASEDNEHEIMPWDHIDMKPAMDIVIHTYLHILVV
jgi:hypothetical protein